MDMKWIKVIGMVASGAGMVATVIANWAGDKQQDAKIAEKIAEAFAEATTKES